MFAFARNPFSRAASSWKHLHAKAIDPKCQKPFSDFAALPSAYAATCLTE